MWASIKAIYELPQSVSAGAIYSAMLDKYRDLLSEENPISNDTKKPGDGEKPKNPNPTQKPNEPTSSIESNERDSDSDIDSDDENGKKDHTVQFLVKMAMKVWDKIKPDDVVYKRGDEDDNYNGRQKITRRTHTRTYKVLKKGVWSYTLARAIAQQKKKVPCRWCFERCKVHPSECAENYITVQGYCITCNAKLKGFVKRMPHIDARFVEFKMIAGNIDYTKHQQRKIQKNIAIRGEQAQSMYGSEDTYGKAARTQRTLLRKCVGKAFEAPVERVPTKNAIRCAQSRYRKMEQIDNCPIKALDILKISYHNDWIQSIGSNPFFVSYVNTDSRILYKVYKKKNKSSTVYCDATGGIAKQLGKQ